MRHRLCRLKDGIGLQTVRFVEGFSQACLLAPFPNRQHFLPSHIRNQELHGVSPDVDDCAPDEFHSG